MSMIDLYAPSMIKCELSEFGIDEKKFYYVAFINNGEINVRPIKISNIYKVYSSEGRYLQTEITFIYYFETKKQFLKKIIDLKFWKNILFKHNENITEKWKITYEKHNTINYEFIAETEDMAKLKLIMIGFKTPYISKEEKKDIISMELEYYNEYKPELVLKAMNFKIPTQYGDLQSYAYNFIDIKGDIRNGI